MKNFLWAGLLAIALVLVPACAGLGAGTLIGTGAGGGAGYGIAKATKSNGTGTTLLTAGGALLGGLIGHQADLAKQSEADRQQLMRESKEVSKSPPTTNPDGTTVTAVCMLHRPTNQLWDYVVQYAPAPAGSFAPPKKIGEWATNWRPAS